MKLNENEVLVTVIPRKVIFKAENPDDESTFIVLGCDVKEKHLVKLNHFKNITVSGANLADVKLNAETVMALSESPNPRYPDGYVARIPVLDIPEDADGQWKFLKAVLTENLVSNFRQVYSSDLKIVEHILDEKNEDDIVQKVNNVGYSNIKVIRKNINDKSEYAKTYTLLSELKMSDVVISKVYNKYEVYKVIKNIVEKDIFRLTEIKGLGFKKVDEIYLKQENSNKEDLNRIASGIEYYILDNQSNGNTRIQKRKLVQGSQTLLDINIKLVKQALDEVTVKVDDSNLQELWRDYARDPDKYKHKIVLYKDRYSAVSTFFTELFVYKDISLRVKNKSNLKPYDMKKLIDDYGKKSGFYLSDEQSQFFYNLFNSEISFLLGSSGSGKSSAQSVLLEYAKETSQSVLFLAPTGMARNRITEVTGNVAYTIHSFILNDMLNETNYDIYMVDESSMVDVVLAQRLLSLIPHGAKVIFVGDGSQIPSVSFGNFLYDCTNNDFVPVDRFTKVFRQSEGGILDIVTKMRQGEQFLPSGFNSRKVFGNNCVFDMRKDRDVKPVQKILASVRSTIETGKYTEDDIIVLSPTKKGANGTVSINKTIQQYLNPPQYNKLEFKSTTDGQDVVFRVGDKVLNKVNQKKLPTYIEVTEGNYMLDAHNGDIVNGDIGKIVRIESGTIYIKFNNILTSMKEKDFNNQSIVHGWAITGHKSQGSEFKVVICLFERSSAFQMNGNLLYTMCSRAKELLLVMGDMDTINRSLKKFENTSRDTNLLDFFDNRVEI